MFILYVQISLYMYTYIVYIIYYILYNIYIYYITYIYILYYIILYIIYYKYYILYIINFICYMYDVMLCYVILQYIVLYDIILYYGKYYIILHYIILYYIILYYIILCYVMLYHIILFYFILYIIFFYLYIILYMCTIDIYIFAYPVYTYGPDFLGACEATQDSRRTSLPLWHVSGSDKRSCSAWRYLHPGKNMERACITFGRLARMRYLTNTVHLRSDTEIHHHERELHVKRPRPSLFVKVSNRVWDQF